MKKLKQLNGFIIKEKRIDEVPKNISPERRYAVFGRDGTWLEDNLTIEESEQYCSNVDEQKLKDTYYNPPVHTNAPKIHTIRAYMDMTGFGLAFSKREVERLIQKWEEST